MAQVKVWNDNTYDFAQTLRDEMIKIKAKSFVLMDYEDAVSFKSKPCGMKVDGSGVQLPESYKMIRIEGEYGATVKDTEMVCHADGKKFHSKTDLEKHVDENFLENLEDKDLAETRKKTKRA